MQRTNKVLVIVAVVFAVMGLSAMSVLAQSGDNQSEYPANTITVTGFGSVQADPDVATVEVGVEIFNSNITTAFSEANQTLEGIVNGLTELGIAAEDIRTSNLSVYNSTQYSAETGSEQRGYYVSNTVRVIVRNVDQITEVIDTAINAGATTLYGLSFDIKDRTALENDARAVAIDNAAARAGHYAELIGASLGDVLVIIEGNASSVYPQARAALQADGVGAGGAFVAPGKSEVQMQVQVTYQLIR